MSAASMLLSTTEDRAITAAPTTFEPVLNVPALGSFVLIMTVFLLLRLRVGAISDAAEARIAALSTLREVKSNELASGAASGEKVAQAVNAYQTALEREEALRTLVPGIRLRAPNNPQRSEADRQAVRQFLTSTDKQQSPNEEQNQLFLDMIQEPEPYIEQDPQQPPFALASALALVFGSQILLFLFLSLDDTTAHQVLTELSTVADPTTSTGGMAEAVGDLMSME